MRNLISIVEALETVEFFHVTPSVNLPSILAHGLIPQAGPRSQQIKGDHGIYLFSSREDAVDAVMNWLGDEFGDEDLTLLSVRLPPGAEVTKEAFEVVCLDPIPADLIRSLGDIDLMESAQRASQFSESADHHGWWITADGEMIETDTPEERYHADIAMSYFDIGASAGDDWEDDDGFDEPEEDMEAREEAIQVAISHGWIRGSAYGKSMTIDYTKPPRAALRALLNWIRTVGSSYQQITIGDGHHDYQNFTDSKSALRFINQSARS